MGGVRERTYRDAFVYFVQCASGPIKIGSAINVNRRLVELQTGCPYELFLLAVTSGGEQREYEYHRQFAAALIRNEWFWPTPELLLEISRFGQRPSWPSRDANLYSGVFAELAERHAIDLIT